MRLKTFSLVALVASSALAAACGGGGGGGTSTGGTAYPLQAGYVARLAAGEQAAFVVSGSCTGLATLIAAPVTTGTFQGVAAQLVARTEAYTFVDCTPASVTSSSVDFYNASDAQIGSTTTDSTLYGVVIPPATTLPATVHVGDAGSRGSIALFANGSGTTLVGQVDRSYAIEADTVAGSTSAVVDFIDSQLDVDARLLQTTQTRYRMDTSGALTKIGVDIQHSTTSTTHLVLTPT